METNIGVVLGRMLRIGACGTWWSASTPGGLALGLLQLEPGRFAAPAARARAAAAVAALRAANPVGVLRTSELVEEAGRAWLVVAAPPTPTVADLITAGGALDRGSAAGIAVDVAQALGALHALGLGHGGLAPETVVLTSAGAATLVEVGLLAALRDAPTDVDRDTGDWARLARELARLAPAPEAEALRAAAATAEVGGLATAARRLASGAADRPDVAAAGVSPAPDRAPGSPRRPRRSLRAIQAATVVVAILLGLGVALWWLLLFR